MDKVTMVELHKIPVRVHTKLIYEWQGDSLVLVREEGYDYVGEWALCDRAAQKEAKQAQGTATQTAAGYGAAAGSTAGVLTPILTRMAQNPYGMTPEEKNAQLVANEQGAGGANASVTGQAGLTANRSRNSGALSNVLDAAARARTQALSRGAQNVEVENTALKNEQQQSALKALRSMYGTQVGAQLGSQGQVAPDINAQVNAGKSGWLQNTLGTIGTLTGGAKDVMQGLYGNAGALG